MDYTVDGHSLWLFVFIALAAVLYSSVGQGGGSGYLAVMAFFAVTPEHMKPAALVMNVFVTSALWYRYQREGDFRWPLLWSFVSTSIPMAFVGGALTLDAVIYRVIVAVALLAAAMRLIWHPAPDQPAQAPSWRATLPVGAVLGLVSGTTGVGGGIFLAPLLLLFRWCTLRETFALSAAFIWVNSLAGVLGYSFTASSWPPDMVWYVVAALAGTVVGMNLLTKHSTPQVLQRILGVVLMIAAIKMLADI